jgi:hypothetical protein
VAILSAIRKRFELLNENRPARNIPLRHSMFNSNIFQQRFGKEITITKKNSELNLIFLIKTKILLNSQILTDLNKFKCKWNVHIFSCLLEIIDEWFWISIA